MILFKALLVILTLHFSLTLKTYNTIWQNLKINFTGMIFVMCVYILNPGWILFSIPIY